MSDILSFWNDQKEEVKQIVKSPDSDIPKAHIASDSPEDGYSVPLPKEAESSIPETQERAQDGTIKPVQFMPHLSGKLADYLSEKSPRQAYSKGVPDPQATGCTLTDPQEMSATATALILASHIVRFAGTALSESHLKSAQDKLLRCFSPKDAVKLEVEAYELLQWLASAFDERWQEQAPDHNASENQSVTSEETLIRIIQLAIAKKRDLDMQYYTGSRGEFSERRITPIEITAEKYLIAFCHLREEERVFRLSRILKLAPVRTDSDENDELSTLSYPSAEDTKLPPLPEVEQSQTKSEKPEKKTNHSVSKHSATRSKKHKENKQKADDTPPLFSFAQNQKVAPKKQRSTGKVGVQDSKPKSHGQSTLPGFDFDK